MEHEAYFDAQIDDDLKLFPPLPLYCLLSVHHIYLTGYEAELVLRKHVEWSTYGIQPSSVVAVGAGKALKLLDDWCAQNLKGQWLEDCYDLYVVGQDVVLGQRYGLETTGYVYISTLNLERSNLFGPTRDCMLVTGERLTRDHLEW